MLKRLVFMVVALCFAVAAPTTFAHENQTEQPIIGIQSDALAVNAVEIVELAINKDYANITENETMQAIGAVLGSYPDQWGSTPRPASNHYLSYSVSLSSWHSNPYAASVSEELQSGQCPGPDCRFSRRIYTKYLS